MAEPGPCVEVLYARAAQQRIVLVRYVPGMTAAEAVERSGLARAFPEIGERELVLGIFGARVPPEHELRAGQRVEICRPLNMDPRDARRSLALRGQTMGGGNPAS